MHSWVMRLVFCSFFTFSAIRWNWRNSTCVLLISVMDDHSHSILRWRISLGLLHDANRQCSASWWRRERLSRDEGEGLGSAVWHASKMAAYTAL
jgi:hypothetical protein